MRAYPRMNKIASHIAKRRYVLYNVGKQDKGGGTMATSASQLKANKKYHAKFERIGIRVSPEEKQAIEAHANQQNESVNAFVQRAIRETMVREKEQI